MYKQRKEGNTATCEPKKKGKKTIKDGGNGEEPKKPITVGTQFTDLYDMHKYRASCDIVGTTDLCIHRFPPDTLREFWERYAGKKKTKKELEKELLDPDKAFNKDPVAQALYYAYWKDGMPDNWEDAQGMPIIFPTIAFHHAMESAIRNYQMITKINEKKWNMTNAKGVFFCVPDTAEGFTDISYETGPHLYQGSTINKNSMNKPRVAIGRALFRNWRCRMNIDFSEISGATPELLFTLLIIAGETVGIGSWRRECGGPFGCFRIENMACHKI
jgi:hypothetical protein